MFLALKKVGVRQYKDSDSKPGVGVSTQHDRRGSGERPRKTVKTLPALGRIGGGGFPPNFFFRKRF